MTITIQRTEHMIDRDKLIEEKYNKALELFYTIEDEDMTAKGYYFAGVSIGLELAKEIANEITTICD